MKKDKTMSGRRSSAEPEVLAGLGVSPGRTAGCVCLFEEGRHNRMPVFTLDTEDDIQREIQRFKKAKEQSIEELSVLYTAVEKKLGRNEAMIFHAHKVIMSDGSIEKEILACVRKSRKNVEFCVEKVFSRYEETIASMDDERTEEGRGGEEGRSRGAPYH